MKCDHWSSAGYCGAGNVRPYLPGHRCATHTPSALKGRLEDTPDESVTLEALVRAKQASHHS